jgi:acyl-coenzyme A thioesterase PaaI-like protein
VSAVAPDPLFRPTASDAVVEATELTRGPWDAGAQHGGAPAALLARAIEAVEPGSDMRVARVTLELLRPVPIARLRVETELVRPGRRVQLVAARLYAADTDTLVLQALALRLRRAQTGAPPVVSSRTAPPLPGPDAAAKLGSATPGLRSFPDDGVELRFAVGHYREAGPATVWIRLNAPVVPGEEPSPLARVLAAADFGNGASAVLDWDRFVFINPDLSVHLERDAEGEWICLEAETTIGADGTGQAVSTLYDQRGRIGRSVQGLFVDRRPE